MKHLCLARAMMSKCGANCQFAHDLIRRAIMGAGANCQFALHFQRSRSCRGERRPETMKIAPGYASLPACQSSITGRVIEDWHAGSVAYPGIFQGAYMSRCDALKQ